MPPPDGERSACPAQEAARAESAALTGIFVVVLLVLAVQAWSAGRPAAPILQQAPAMPAKPAPVVSLYPTARPTPTEAPPLPAGGLDLNAASAPELEHLPGIGPKLAERIVAERLAGGPFAQVGDLRRVKGIGPKTLARLSPFVRIGREGQLAGQP